MSDDKILVFSSHHVGKLLVHSKFKPPELKFTLCTTGSNRVECFNEIEGFLSRANILAPESLKGKTEWAGKSSKIRNSLAELAGSILKVMQPARRVCRARCRTRLFSGPWAY